MKVTPRRVLVHTPTNHIPMAEVYRSADGTKVMLCIKKARSHVYEEIELFAFIRCILNALEQSDSAA